MRKLLLLTPAAVLLAACGSSHTGAPTPSTSTLPATTAARRTTTAPRHTPTQPTTPSPSALQAEANSAAAGDIPDNQVFLVFHDSAGGYSMKYPEGWAQQGSGRRVTFRDKNNIVRVVIAASAPTAAAVRRQLAKLGGARLQSGPQRLTLAGRPALKVAYRTVSRPNAVTGKRVTLTVDRYYLSHAGAEAIVDLGTPVGVDNVDAYRLMIESFRWR
jgi:hypothetical protein